MAAQRGHLCIMLLQDGCSHPPCVSRASVAAALCVLLLQSKSVSRVRSAFRLQCALNYSVETGKIRICEGRIRRKRNSGRTFRLARTPPPPSARVCAREPSRLGSMASIDKMSIRGIRSFSPTETQVIEFYKPLTLCAPVEPSVVAMAASLLKSVCVCCAAGSWERTDLERR